jgi:uncharacterized protein YyaL (SSP411 family)
MNHRRADIVLLMMSLTVVLAPGLRAQSTPTAATLQQWGEEALEVIDRELWLPERTLYAERTARRGPAEPAFMWSAGVQLTALAAAARLNPERYTERLTQYADALDAYWKEHNGVAGYNVLPAPAEPDRYYDDNAWIVLALIEINDVAPNDRRLDRAEATLKFVLSGEDDALGGGVYWREKERTSKNTCSNAPTIAAALRLYQRRPDPQWLAAAERLHAWTVNRLQAEDGLMWDNVKLDGKVDRRQYTYNTALMIRACCVFHEINDQPQWLAEAQRMARAAEAKWVRPESGAIADAGRFAHMLLEAWLAVYALDHDPHWLETIRRALADLHEHRRDDQNRYSGSWERSARSRRGGMMLIDQASAARAFLVAAEAVRDADVAPRP